MRFNTQVNFLIPIITSASPRADCTNTLLVEWERVSIESAASHENYRRYCPCVFLPSSFVLTRDPAARRYFHIASPHTESAFSSYLSFMSWCSLLQGRVFLVNSKLASPRPRLLTRFSANLRRLNASLQSFLRLYIYILRMYITRARSLPKRGTDFNLPMKRSARRNARNLVPRLFNMTVMENTTRV